MNKRCSEAIRNVRHVMSERKILRALFSGAIALGDKFVVDGRECDLPAMIDDYNCGAPMGSIRILGKNISTQGSHLVFLWLYRQRVPHRFWGWFHLPTREELIASV